MKIRNLPIIINCSSVEALGPNDSRGFLNDYALRKMPRAMDALHRQTPFSANDNTAPSDPRGRTARRKSTSRTMVS
jgi:hypothetical protein